MAEARYVVIGAGHNGLVTAFYMARAGRSIAEFSRHDSERYSGFLDAVRRITGALENLLEMTPPDIDRPTADDLWRLLRAGGKIKRLGRQDLYRLLRWGPMAAADLA